MTASPPIKDVPLSCECPNCGEDRLQYGYDREELLEMLRAGAAIQAYCSACDEHWEMSTEERADIARALNG